MATEIGSLFVKLGLQSQGFKRGMTAAIRDLGSASKAAKQTNQAFSGMNRTIKMVGTAIAGFVGFRILSRQVSEFIQLAGRQEQAVAGMEQALKSMGRYSPTLSKNLQKLASEIQNVTTFGDEAILEGQKFLLTYKGIGDEVVPRATKTMADLAALMGGDTRQAANMLGKASMGLTGELRRVGITVEKSTFEAEGFLGVLREIEEQVGGQAQALRNTEYGGLQALGNIAGDVKEKLGQIILLKMKDTFEGWHAALVKVNDVLKGMVSEAELRSKFEQYSEAMTESTGVLDKAREKVAEWGQSFLDWRKRASQASNEFLYEEEANFAKYKRLIELDKALRETAAAEETITQTQKRKKAELDLTKAQEKEWKKRAALTKKAHEEDLKALKIAGESQAEIDADRIKELEKTRKEVEALGTAWEEYQDLTMETQIETNRILEREAEKNAKRIAQTYGKAAGNIVRDFGSEVSGYLTGQFESISDAWDRMWKTMVDRAISATANIIAESVATAATDWVFGLFAAQGVENVRDPTGRGVPAVVHEGEMIVPADIADKIRSEAGNVQGDPFGMVGGFTAEAPGPVAQAFMSGTASKYGTTGLKGMGFMGMGQISPSGFLTGMASPQAILGAALFGGVPSAIGEAMGISPGVAQTSMGLGFLGAAAAGLSGPVSLATGLVAVGLAGVLADAFDMRSNEQLRDEIEDILGEAKGRAYYSNIVAPALKNDEEFLDAVNAVNEALGPISGGTSFASMETGESEGYGGSVGGGGFGMGTGGAGGVMVHTGSPFIPKEQPYVLDRGERVFSRTQNEDLIDAINSALASGGSGPVLINQGVITTDDVDRWFADRNRRARTYKVGKTMSTEDPYVAGLTAA